MKALELLQQKKITEAQAYDMLLAFALDCFDYINAPRRLKNTDAAFSVGLAFEYDDNSIPNYEIYPPNPEPELEFEPRSVWVLLHRVSYRPPAKEFAKELRQIERFIEKMLFGDSGIIIEYD